MGNKYIVGDLYVNDSKVITEDTLPESSNFSGSYNDLTDKPTIPTVPTKVSAFENDSKYVTEDAINGKYSEGLAYTLKDDGTYEVTGIGTCSDTDIIIPLLYNGEYVVGIGSSAFEGRSSLTSITIPDSVTSIGESAFHNCSNLTSVKIGNTVTTIGKSAFSGCSSLTSITIPDSVTSIGQFAFKSCTSLASITTPFVGATKDGTSNTYLGYILDGNNITSSYTSLKTVIVTSGTTLGNFQGCRNLTSITIPNTVTSIGWGAFYNCTSLTSIIIPDSVTSIDTDTFNGCTSLTSVTIGDSVTSISNSMFNNCTSLTSVTIPDSVTSIGSSAFSGCSSLKNVVIPSSVTSIGAFVFKGCTNLVSIMIPASVTSIQNDLSTDCSNLTIYCETQSEPQGWVINGWNRGNRPVVWGAAMDFAGVNSKISNKELYLYSSTAGSTKKFKITVDDNGTITATAVN